MPINPGWTVQSVDWTVKFKFGKDALRIELLN
jgi:hypothetical protein